MRSPVVGHSVRRFHARLGILVIMILLGFGPLGGFDAPGGSAASLAGEAAPDVRMATFFGTEKADLLAAAAFLPDGSVVLGGTVGGARGAKGDGVEGGQGIVVVLRPDGHKTAEKSLPSPVSDLDVDAAGNVLVVGTAGTMALDAALSRAVWTSDVGGADARLCAGPDGTAIVLSGKTVAILDRRGTVSGRFDVQGGYLTDVACDPALRLIYVCGFDNKRGTPPGQKNYPVQVAFVRALGFDGKPAWQAYGWGGQQVADLHLMADTRAYRLFAAGGKLYVAGESAGGNTIWTRGSLDLAAKDHFVTGDAFQHAYNTSANHITALARLDAKTGRSEAATLLLARLSSGKGNTIRPRAVAADAEGNVYVGGASAFSPPKSPGSYGREGGGAYFVVFDARFQRRHATTLAGGGTTRAITVGPRGVVAVGDCSTEFQPVKPLKAEGDAQGDGFVVWFSAPWPAP